MLAMVKPRLSTLPLRSAGPQDRQDHPDHALVPEFQSNPMGLPLPLRLAHDSGPGLHRLSLHHRPRHEGDAKKGLTA
jgi:hypothetical protein